MRLQSKVISSCITLLCLSLLLVPSTASPQQGNNAAELKGTVTLSQNGKPIRSASITILQLNRSVLTDGNGQYRFTDLPAGTYDVLSHMHSLTSEVQKIRLEPGQALTVDFQLSVRPIQYELTITPSGKEVTPFEAFQSVAVVDNIQLRESSAFGLGDVIAAESGVHKRSFGPGSSRPVLRGFDGDRVLILYDGLSTGTLSAQSGEHAEPVDAAHLDRIEIVKGPATLLYGSNALGGVVNMVTAHHLMHERPHPGPRGQLTLMGGTNGNPASAHASGEYGTGRWVFWGSGARQVSNDYSSADGPVDNSKTRLSSGSLGVGWYGDQPFFNLSYAMNDGRLGIPYAGKFHHHHDHDEGEDHDHEDNEALVDEVFSWQNVRMNVGMRGLKAAVEEFKIAAAFSRWKHRELENEETATSFDNKLFNLRFTVTPRKWKRLSGTTGFHAFYRDYEASGEEALSPPVTGKGFALFTLQELDLQAFRFQFGGRFDHISYQPVGLKHRSFSGFSGAAGIHVPLWRQGAFVVNYTHSFRTPAIEELYNHGAHIGNLAFEIGNAGMKAESANGIDVALRHKGSRLEAEGNFYFYALHDFVYMHLTGEWKDGLRVALFSQDNARFIGGEASLNVALHPGIWWISGMDVVDARLSRTDTPLPRIPPLRGRVGVDVRMRGFGVRPEIVMAAAQDAVYPTETHTPGYTLVNLTGSYTLASSRFVHVFSVGVSNAGDRLYRNHLSFIKDFAPEMGRCVRFNYNVQFF